MGVSRIQRRIEECALRGPSPLSFPSTVPFPSLLAVVSPPLPPLLSYFLPLPLELGPVFAATGSGGALKLPHLVRAEPGCQTVLVNCRLK